MSEGKHEFTIVAAIDMSEFSDAVISRAFDVAARQGGAAVHFVSVVPTGRGFLHRTTDHSGELEELQGRLREQVAMVGSAFADAVAPEDEDRWRIGIHVRAGVPVEEIVDVVDEAEADLVLLGRHGWNGAKRRFLGSVSERVARAVHCSVMLVQPADYAAHEDTPICEACASTRRETGGERWFCETHAGDRGFSHVSLGPGLLTRGGTFF